MFEDKLFGNPIKSARYIAFTIRIWNTRVMILFYLLGRAISSTIIVDRDLVFVPIMVICGYAGISLMNYYYDLSIDRVNKRANPFMTHMLRPERALTIVAILQSISIVAAAFTTIAEVAIQASMLIFLLGYIYKSKNYSLSHNPYWKIGLMMAAYILVPGFLGISYNPSMYAFVVIFLLAVLFASWMVFNDIKDIQGDRRYGKRTLAVSWGRKKLALVSFAVSLTCSLFLLIYLPKNIVVATGIGIIVLMHAAVVQSPALLLRRNILRVGGYVGFLFLLVLLFQFQTL